MGLISKIMYLLDVMQVPSLIDSAVIVSLITGAWTTSSQLTTVKAEMTTMTTSIEGLKKSIEELKKSMDESTKSTADSIAELSRVIAGVK